MMKTKSIKKSSHKAILWIVLLTGVFLLPVSAYSQSLSREEEDGKDTIVRKPSRVLHFIEGVQVTEEEAIGLLLKGVLDPYPEGRISHKDAIRFYGEKYRYGVHSGNTKKKMRR